MSIQTTHNFTGPQLLKIHDVLQYIGECNGIGSDCKVDGIEMFKDKHNSFFVSYAFHSVGERGPKSSLQYFEIDTEGNKIDLKERYENVSDIVTKLSRLDKINFID
jgi:hypothetical protein